MVAQSVTDRAVFDVLYVERDPIRVMAFKQAFGRMVTITSESSCEGAVRQLKRGRVVDLIVINDAVGGMIFLNAVEADRIRSNFATVLLVDGASLDLNVQVDGTPVIDVFPLDFDVDVLRTRLDYFVQKKRLQTGQYDSADEAILPMPIGKRLFDIVVSLTMLLILSPLLLVVAALITLDSKGPVFYKSRRVGMGYKVFDMYKFRTMRTGADKLIAGMASQNMYNSVLPELTPDERCEGCQLANTNCQQPLFQDSKQVCAVQIRRMRQGKATFMKFKEDPRVTHLGKFLRNTSIDELPQLLNILKGDMSFVGNRPLPLYEAEKLTRSAYARRFAAPAGLTGLWQVTKRGKANVSDQERIQLDALYAKTYSFKTDLVILLRTVKAVFQTENV